MEKEINPQILEEELNYYGSRAAGIMQDLSSKLPRLKSAMLCTEEGFNICSIGFADDQVSKMAAVSSSLYAMAKSVLDAFSNNKNGTINTISINSSEMDILGKRIDIPDERQFILIISCNDTKVGVQLYAAEFVEKEFRNALKNK